MPVSPLKRPFESKVETLDDVESKLPLSYSPIASDQDVGKPTFYILILTYIIKNNIRMDRVHTGVLVGAHWRAGCLKAASTEFSF